MCCGWWFFAPHTLTFFSLSPFYAINSCLSFSYFVDCAVSKNLHTPFDTIVGMFIIKMYEIVEESNAFRKPHINFWTGCVFHAHVFRWESLICIEVIMMRTAFPSRTWWNMIFFSGLDNDNENWHRPFGSEILIRNLILCGVFRM